MVEALFATLLGMVLLFTGVYCFYYDRKSLTWLVLLGAVSFASLSLPSLSLFLFLPLLYYKKLPYGLFAGSSMLAAVSFSFLLLHLFESIFFPYKLAAFASLMVICLLAVAGVFEKNLRKYLLISNAAQVTFVFLDLSVGMMTGAEIIIKTAQVFHYSIAGLCLFLTIGVFARGKEYVHELRGFVFYNKWNDAFATIACLSLAGLPGFNIFISEWVLFTTAFKTSPSISLLGVFAALLLFIMYYKIVYVLLVGEGEKRKVPKPVTFLNGVLAGSIIILGLVPQITWRLLSMVA